MRTLISGAFSGRPDQLIDDCVGKIKEAKDLDVGSLFDVIRSQGRSLELTEDRFWQIGYGSDSIHLLFNLWYKNFNYNPAYENNLPQVDHIFPQSALKKIKIPSPETGHMVMKYKQDERNQLANCMLLTQTENGAGGKSDILPDVWFQDKDDSYLEMHLIPKDRSLWKLEKFEDFMQAYRQQINYFADIKVQGNNIIEKTFALHLPVPYLSLLLEDCIASGRDYNAGGARYNTTYIQGVGLGSITDILTSIRYNIYDRKRFTWNELLTALKDNFEGHEEMQ